MLYDYDDQEGNHVRNDAKMVPLALAGIAGAGIGAVILVVVILYLVKR